jgi:hypothetical protein
MKMFMLTGLPIGTVVTTASSQMLYLNRGKRFLDKNGRERFGKPRKGDVERWRGRARGVIVDVWKSERSVWTDYGVRHDDGKIFHYLHVDIDSWEEPPLIQIESVDQRQLTESNERRKA